MTSPASAGLAPVEPGRLPCGLRLFPAEIGPAVRDIWTAIAGVTALVLLLDGLVFRTHLPQLISEYYASPLALRTPLAELGAIGEELKGRLLAMTAIVMLLSAAAARRPSATTFVVAIVLSQFMLVWPLVVAFPLYSTLRFWLVGCAWGWLYWRHGWLAAVTGHACVHLVLDPLLIAFA